MPTVLVDTAIVLQFFKVLSSSGQRLPHFPVVYPLPVRERAVPFLGFVDEILGG
jgi:hypothetical protein